MKIDLDSKDLLNLVHGITPSYNVFENSLVRKCGYYIGGFVDKWEWSDIALSDLSESELYKLYKVCKESWKSKKQ